MIKTTSAGRKFNLAYCLSAKGTNYIWTGPSREDTGTKDDEGNWIYKDIILSNGENNVRIDSDRFNECKKLENKLISTALRNMARGAEDKTLRVNLTGAERLRIRDMAKTAILQREFV